MSNFKRHHALYIYLANAPPPSKQVLNIGCYPRALGKPCRIIPEFCYGDFWSDEELNRIGRHRTGSGNLYVSQGRQPAFEQMIDIVHRYVEAIKPLVRDGMIRLGRSWGHQRLANILQQYDPNIWQHEYLPDKSLLGFNAKYDMADLDRGVLIEIDGKQHV